MHARNLFHLSTAMYDAWSAFDPTAAQYVHQEKLSAGELAGLNVESARNEAVSYAAYNLIKHRFVSGPAGCEM